MRKFDFVWSLLCLLLLISCHHKKPDETVETILVYPEATMPQKFVTTDFASDSIFNLPEEMSVPSRLFQKTDGLNSRLITLMVKQWYVVKQIKYAENYKMWLLISDQKEACMLLTLNENNEPIDGLPVALHLSLQNKDIVEQEEWSSIFTDSSTLIINKNYDYTKSIANVDETYYETHRDEFSHQTTQKDEYRIEEDGHFTYIAVPEKNTYNAVIFFNDRDVFPENWNMRMDDVQSLCEEAQILVIETRENFDHVPIYDYLMDTLDVISIQKYVQRFHTGIVLCSKGESPRYLDINSKASTLYNDMEAYFKIQF